MKDFLYNEILISVTVPVFNTAKTIFETLDSLNNQTLDKEYFEVNVVDDCSTDPETQKIINDLENKGYKDLQLNVYRHETNKWLAEVRNTGAKIAKGKYLCSLDSDDILAENYLKDSVLVLESNPVAGWVYPVLKEFGYINAIHYPLEFNAKKFFIENSIPCASVMRKKVWDEVGGQRTVIVTGKTKWFEDWDFWIRAMAKGWFGVPIRDTIFYYRRAPMSMMTRPRLVHFLSIYLVYRLNFINYLFIWKAQRNYIKSCKNLYGKQNIIICIFNRISGFMINRLYKDSVKTYPFNLFLLSFFFPKGFVNSVLTNKYLPTSSEKMSGLNRRLKLKYLE